jgi:NADPH:quinone reductase-like Zn-dependent oxidoreductase
MRVVLATRERSLAPPECIAQSAVDVAGHRLTLALAEMPDPNYDARAPENADWVLVRVRAFSLNYRDRAILCGQAVPSADPGQGFGSELVAEVVALGAAVPSLRVGQRVITTLAWPEAPPGAVPGIATNAASRELQAFHHGKLVPVPDDMSDDVAAGFALGAQTAFSMVRRAAATPGERVLLTSACSNTSLFALRALRRVGARVFATTSSAVGAPLLEDVRAERVVHLAERGNLEPVADLASELGGFDAVVDPFSDIHLHQAVKFLRFFGRYVTCGLAAQGLPPADQPAGDWRETLADAIVRNVTLIGNCLGSKEDLDAALAAWAAGELDVTIDSVHSGSAIGEFVERTFNAPDRLDKVIYRYGDPASDSNRRRVGLSE